MHTEASIRLESLLCPKVMMVSCPPCGGDSTADEQVVAVMAVMVMLVAVKQSFT